MRTVYYFSPNFGPHREMAQRLAAHLTKNGIFSLPRPNHPGTQVDLDGDLKDERVLRLIDDWALKMVDDAAALGWGHDYFDRSDTFLYRPASLARYLRDRGHTVWMMAGHDGADEPGQEYDLSACYLITPGLLKDEFYRLHDQWDRAERPEFYRELEARQAGGE